jgi:hypothetical protein
MYMFSALPSILLERLGKELMTIRASSKNISQNLPRKKDLQARSKLVPMGEIGSGWRRVQPQPERAMLKSREVVMFKFRMHLLQAL